MKSMLLIVAFTLLAKPLLPLAEYVIHYERIVRELCEKRDEPESDCNGSCYLKKQLAKASGTNDPSTDRKVKMAETEILFLEVPAQLYLPSARILATRVSCSYLNHYHYSGNLKVFHPPSQS